MTTRIPKLAVVIAVGIFALGLVPSAHASAIMYLCLTTAPGNIGGDCTGTTYDYVQILSDGTAGGTTITQNGSSYSLGSGITIGPGDISFTGTIGGWTLNLATGQSFAPNGGADLNTEDTYCGGGLTGAPLTACESQANTLDIYWDALNNQGIYTALIEGTNLSMANC